MEVFVARQPIFDRHKKVFAYELLYRKENTLSSQISDSDKATSEVVTNTLLLIGIDSLTGGKKAFINFTRNLLENEFAAMFPNELVAVEILEDIVPDANVILACKRLKEQGYTLVLDDFVYSPCFDPLIEIADFIKVDFLDTPIEQRLHLVEKFRPRNIKFIAEKIESLEEFEQAVKMGYDYFQGYFFSKPVIVTGRDMSTYKWSYLQLIKEINEKEPDFNKIEETIRKDVSLAYKLLKYINSAVYGFNHKILSIKHALVLLGITEIKKWVSLVALKSISDDKPDEIMRISVLRARFGELISEKMGLSHLKSDIFLIGLFSMIDSLTGIPMESAVLQLPLATDVQDAILGKECFYRNIFDLVLSYERGDWDEVCRLSASFGLDTSLIASAFVSAVNWTDELFAS